MKYQINPCQTQLKAAPKTATRAAAYSTLSSSLTRKNQELLKNYFFYWLTKSLTIIAKL